VSNVLAGAYVSIDQLLRLRFRPKPQRVLRASNITGAQAGLRLSKQKGRGVDFAEVRQYQPGDDVRSIDWRVTARKNAPHTKIFREERERPALLFVDQGQHMFFGSKQRLKSVAAAELSARIAWQITEGGDRVGGLVLDNHGHHLFRPFRTAKATGQLLQQVAQSNQQLRRSVAATASAETAQQRLGDALSALAMLRSKRNRVFIISDLAGSLEIWRDWLHRLARKHEVHVLQITDPLDVQLPPAGMYNIRHGQEHVSFFAGDKKLRQRYAETYRARTQTIADICRHPALVHQSLSTEDTDWDALAWT
jgi:uncharacterized protein (DUF58 family)